MLTNRHTVAPSPEERSQPDLSGAPIYKHPDELRKLAQLLAAASVALDADRRAARTCIQRAAALLEIDLGQERPAHNERPRLRGGLAPWQARRVGTYIEENLALTIHSADLAELVQLSPSHFFRAFRESFGETPHACIMRQRILRAQKLILTSPRPLLHIALECGINSHPHFTRAFRRVAGMNPNVWRRQFLVQVRYPGSANNE